MSLSRGMGTHTAAGPTDGILLSDGTGKLRRQTALWMDLSGVMR